MPPLEFGILKNYVYNTMQCSKTLILDRCFQPPSRERSASEKESRIKRWIGRERDKDGKKLKRERKLQEKKRRRRRIQRERERESERVHVGEEKKR